MALKTYLLAPNFTLEPDGPLRIGVIIADPFRPTKSLHVPETDPITVTHKGLESSHTRENTRAFHGGIWAQFLQSASSMVGAGINKDVLTQYTMDSVETVRIKEDPTDEDAAKLVKHPDIQAIMKSGIYGLAPVYMITGIKIAKGFRLASRNVHKGETQAGAIASVTENVRIGGELNVSRGQTIEDTTHSESDIVFAYQLHVIAQKGWWTKKVSADIYAPSTAFLSENRSSTVQDEIAVGVLTKEHLLSVAKENEDDPVGIVEVVEDDETCFCVSFQETDI